MPWAGGGRVGYYGVGWESAGRVVFINTFDLLRFLKDIARSPCLRGRTKGDHSGIRDL